MDILVFSDSHGAGDKIEEAIKRQIKNPAAIIFLGDGLRDIEYAQIGDIPVYSVSGNCDFGLFAIRANDEHTISLGGKRIFFAHGHRYGVKSTLTPIISKAINEEADILLFGHTHEALEWCIDSENRLGIKTDKPLYIMNPGSIGSYPYRFGVITIDHTGRVLLSHGSLE